MRHVTRMGLLAVALLGAQADEARQATLEISKDTTLDPKKTYGAIRITASNVTVDGQGAWIVGRAEGNPTSFLGVGIEASGVSKVTLRNLNVKGFSTALRASDGTGWTVEGCDFSGNYHDPDFGWGGGERVGGVILTRMHRCTFRKNKAQRVWNGLDLWECDENLIAENAFSHCSNVCLKLWRSCRNQVLKNDLSYGIRCNPGETHARDSTCVLMEHASDGNRFVGNDITYGGDGIFLRSLNNVVSTGNHFEGNDTSYAHNNCVECWSPGNAFVRNKANHGSYGFWMGGSDRSVLLENEAAWNGDPEGKGAGRLVRSAAT